MHPAAYQSHLTVPEFNSLFHIKNSTEGELQPYIKQKGQKKIVDAVMTFHSVVTKILNVIKRIVSPIFKGFAALKRAILCRKSEQKLLQELNGDAAVSLREAGSVSVTTETRCFDAKFQYVLSDGAIYFKPVGQNELLWRPFGSEGVPSSLVDPDDRIASISADGANLIAVDSKGRVHYTKTKKIQYSKDDKQWHLTQFETKWSRKWINTTLIAPIRNLIIDPTLYVDPEKIKKTAISQKGPDTLYYYDTLGKVHPEPFVGVTQLYGLSCDGTEIYMADPWLTNEFNYSYTGPEEGRFQAENLAASASTIFLIKRHRDEEGKEQNILYTRFVDFDSSGNNKGLPGTYNPNNRTPLVRSYLAEDWTKQPSIPLAGDAKLTSEIAISQTGRGNAKRELRVLGTNEEGISGYYFKKIYAKEWQFAETGEEIPNDAFLNEEAPIGAQKGPSHSIKCKGEIRSSLSFTPEVSLRKYLKRGKNERGLHTTVDFTLPSGKVMHCHLRATQDGWNFMAHLFNMERKQMHWDLIVPDDYFHDNDPEVQEIMKSIFRGKHAISVHVDEGDAIHIRPSFFHCRGFQLTFNS